MFRGPAYRQPFLLVGLRDDVKVDVIHFLVSDAAVVLQDIVVGGTDGGSNLLHYRLFGPRLIEVMCIRSSRETYKDFGQLVIGNVRQLCAVMLRYDELEESVSCNALLSSEGAVGGSLTEWPWLRGPMSRNAKTLSDSNIFIDGISPIMSC